MMVSPAPVRSARHSRTIVRRFDPDDLASVLLIERYAFPPSVAYSAARFQQLFALHPDGFWVAADPNAEVIGDIVAYLQKGTGEIDTIAVATRYRGRGIGGQLMDTALRSLARQGARAVGLEVATRNRVAQAFFEKLGFRRIRKLANYYGVGEDAYRMRRALDTRPRR